MYEKYHDQGFEIIDVPCNQFAGQAPESDEEIHEFCQLKYNTHFPQMKKTDVNGETATPLFKYLKEQKGFEGFGKGPKAMAMSAMLHKIDKDYKNNSEIKWNFTKFVIDRQGNLDGEIAGKCQHLRAVSSEGQLHFVVQNVYLGEYSILSFGLPVGFLPNAFVFIIDIRTAAPADRQRQHVLTL